MAKCSAEGMVFVGCWWGGMRFAIFVFFWFINAYEIDLSFSVVPHALPLPIPIPACRVLINSVCSITPDLALVLSFSIRRTDNDICALSLNVCWYVLFSVNIHISIGGWVAWIGRWGITV
uniref:Putative secreted peptide n=1 Tax=Anopheles braziliensis TaxID=58242 RepID=A0A2M3ZNX9_9DIPT